MDKHFAEFWRVGVIGREITKGLGSTLGGDFHFFNRNSQQQVKNFLSVSKMEAAVFERDKATLTTVMQFIRGKFVYLISTEFCGYLILRF